jgi:hypothetical protein
MKDHERQTELASLWLSHYSPDKRTAHNVISFYGWVRDHRPELLVRQTHDPLLRLKADLRGHIRPR